MRDVSSRTPSRVPRSNAGPGRNAASRHPSHPQRCSSATRAPPRRRATAHDRPHSTTCACAILACMQASTSPAEPPTPAPTPAPPAELAEQLLALWRAVMAPRGVSAYAIFEELDLTLTQVKALSALAPDGRAHGQGARRAPRPVAARRQPRRRRARRARAARPPRGHDRPAHEAPDLHRRRPRRPAPPRRGAPRRPRAVHRHDPRRAAQAPLRRAGPDPRRPAAAHGGGAP